jgi:hypothetical protein
VFESIQKSAYQVARRRLIFTAWRLGEKCWIRGQIRHYSSSSLIVDFLRLALSILPFALLHSLAWPSISAFGVSRDRRKNYYRCVAGDHTRLCWRPDRWCAPGPAFCSLCVSVFQFSFSSSTLFCCSGPGFFSFSFLFFSQF